MTKYEMIKAVINSDKITENDKLNYIQLILGNWLKENDIKWIWEE